MKKFFIFPFTLVLLAMLTIVGCSEDDDNVVGPNEQEPEQVPEQEPTRQDSATIVSLLFEDFTSIDQVKIEKADSTCISVSNDLLKKIGFSEVKRGNFISVWQNIKSMPIYLRAEKVTSSDDRTVIEGKRVSVYESFEDMKFKMSTDIYYDASRQSTRSAAMRPVTRAGLMEDLSAYDEIVDDTLVIHPYAYIPGNSGTRAGNNDEDADLNPLVGQMGNNAYLIRDMFYEGMIKDASKVPNGSESSQSYIDLNHKFSFDIPIYGGMTRDINGSIWTNLIKRSKEGLGEGSDNPATFKVRLKGLGVGLKAGYRIYHEWSWFRPSKIEFTTSTDYSLSLDTLGLTGGIAVAGDHILKDWESSIFFFMIGPIPVFIQLHPMFVFKYNLDAHIAAEYNIGLDTGIGFTTGFKWVRGDGVTPIGKVRPHFDIYKPKSIADFLEHSRIAAEGNAQAAIVFRTAILIEALAGPTFGLGVKANLDLSIGADSDLDENGNYIGTRPDARAYGYIAPIGEIGGEMSMLGYRIWNRAYDIPIGSYKWEFLDLH